MLSGLCPTGVCFQCSTLRGLSEEEAQMICRIPGGDVSGEHEGNKEMGLFVQRIQFCT